MRLSEFREMTKDYPDDAEIVIAGGMDVLRGIQSGALMQSEHSPRTAKVFALAGNTDAVILEL